MRRIKFAVAGPWNFPDLKSDVFFGVIQIMQTVLCWRTRTFRAQLKYPVGRLEKNKFHQR